LRQRVLWKAGKRCWGKFREERIPVLYGARVNTKGPTFAGLNFTLGSDEGKDRRARA